MELDDYTDLEHLHTGKNIILYRARDQNKNLCILKVISTEYPSPEDVHKLQNEYSLLNEIQSEYVINVLEISKKAKKKYIVIEDIDAKSLESQLGLLYGNYEKIILLFINICKGLSDIHKSNIVHKDINPSNILYIHDTSKIKIIDFGISAKSYSHSSEFKHVNKIEGTLFYIAPEQTGRVNRGIDQRTDLYSLGITLYRILTHGVLPFISEDFMEIIHKQIAVEPIPPIKINPNLPSILSEITLKLLSKNPEDRYNSAKGLQRDLEKCLESWMQYKSIPTFQLGIQDINSELSFIPKLYGREKEEKQILEAFQNACSGEPSLFLIGGYSGIGKTSLVNELFQSITEKKGIYVSGKFDQYQKNIPFYAITQAFNSIIEYLLSESPNELEIWKKKILEITGSKAQVLIDVIPSLEIIIGKQPPVPALNPTETQNRFIEIFQEFWKIIDTKDHPLTIFIDDLQWADSASLALLQNILKLVKNGTYFIIGAYRDNEIDANHKMIPFLESLKKEEVSITEVILKNLDSSDTFHFIQDSLHSNSETTKVLNHYIYQKSNGNPFFTIELIKNIYKNNILFLSEKGSWEINEDKLSNYKISANVVDLLKEKINVLSDDVKEILKIASCIGNQFDLESIYFLKNTQKEDTSVLQVINILLQDGFIQTVNNSILNSKEQSNALLFKFSHDRIHQASYLLLSEEEKLNFHYKLGSVLLNKFQFQDDKLFIIADHWNESISKINSESERVSHIKINHLSAVKSKEATAYESAILFLNIGNDLIEEYGLTEKIWQIDFDLSYQFFLLKGEIEYILGNFKKSTETITKAIEKCNTNFQKASAYQSLIVQNTLLANYDDAISLGRKALGLLGIELPSENYEEARDLEIDSIFQKIGDKSISSLYDLPLMTDKEKILSVNLLITMGPPCYRYHQRLWGFIVSKVVNLTIEFGNVPEVSYSHTAFGGLLGFVKKDYSKTKEFGDLAVRLMRDKFHAPSSQSVFYLMIGSSVRHWISPLSKSSDDYMNAYNVGVESSNLQFSAYAFGHNMYCMFFRGIPLTELSEFIKRSLLFSRSRKNWWAIDLLEGGELITKNLVMNTNFEELENIEVQYIDKSISHKNIQVICIYYIMKSITFYTLDRYEDSKKYLDKAEEYILTVQTQGLLPTSEFVFIQSLLLYKSSPDLLKDSKSKESILLDKNLELLLIWKNSSPENYLPRYNMVLSIKTILGGKFLEAIDLLDAAIDSFSKSENYLYMGMAAEMAATLFTELNKYKLAKPYLKDAYYYFSVYGATNKNLLMSFKYKEILDLEKTLENESDSSLAKTSSNTFKDKISTGTISRTTTSKNGNSLDMSSVIKATQAISGEIQLNELLKKLIKITVENAGAVTGILILLKEGSLFIEAEYNINTMAINILKSLPVVESKKVPLSILNYVESKKEILILKDATLEKKFSRDDYIISNKPKSVLCMPLLNQGKLTGILYLEHPHLPGAFTDDRIETLKILSSQASISIDNARLYDDMTELNTAYERFFPGNFLELLEKKNITKILLGDQVQKNMSILFSDIRSFTSLSEKMSPQDNFNFINSYLKRVGPVIRKYDGFIDKFIGDAVMALFPDSPNTAIDASISMLDEVYLMNQKRKSKGYQSISIGIGVHTGSLILGVVGEHNRMAGTVISDSVNLASRLEGLTKMYNTNLITSLTTYNALSNKEKYIHRVLDRVRVKGKQEAVTVIEILNGLGNKLIDLKLSTKEHFERGASLYSSKEFIGSIESFRNVLKIDPLDKAADIYLKRAEYYSKVGVPPDWEGIESLDTK